MTQYPIATVPVAHLDTSAVARMERFAHRALGMGARVRSLPFTIVNEAAHQIRPDNVRVYLTIPSGPTIALGWRPWIILVRVLVQGPDGKPREDWQAMCRGDGAIYRWPTREEAEHIRRMCYPGLDSDRVRVATEGSAPTPHP